MPGRLSAGQQARLFAAVDLPAELSQGLVAWGREAAGALGAGRSGHGMRVLDAEGLHLTLSFLGGRPAGEVALLMDELASACQDFASLELTMGAPVWLPPRRPRALAVDVHDPTGDLARLQSAVERALATSERKPRRYLPHVTVARTRADFRVPRDLPLPPTPPEGFRAQSVSLVRSRLEPQGARYEAQGSIELGADER